MASRPIEVEIRLQSEGVESGAERVADSFSDVQDELRDTGRAAERAGDEMQDAAREAARVIDRDLTQALDEVQDQARTTGRTVGREVEDGTRRASEGMDEFRDEANSTAREAAASFDGSADSIGDMFQEVAANAFAGFGPAGAAAGLAIAAGMGIALAALNKVSEDATASKEDIISIAQAIREHGGEFGMEAAISAMDEYGDTIQDTKEWWEVFQSEALSGWDKLREQSEATGLTMQEIFRGRFADDAEESKRQVELLGKQIEELDEQWQGAQATINESGGAIRDNAEEILKQRNITEEARKGVEEHVKKLEAAKVIEEARKAAIAGTTQALKENLDAERERANGLSSQIDAQQETLQGWRDLNAEIETNGKNIDITTEAGSKQVDVWQDITSGINAEIDAMVDSGATVAEVSAKYNSAYDAMLAKVQSTYGMSREEASKWLETLGLVPPEKVVELKTTGKEQVAEDAKEAAKTEDKPIALTVTGADGVQKEIASLPSGTEVFVDVDDNYTVHEVQKRIDGIRGREGSSGPFIDVDDNYTVRAVQDRIDGIRGKDVYVNLKIGNEWQFQQDIARLTEAATKIINVETRGGVGITN